MNRNELVRKITTDSIGYEDIPHLIELFIVEPQLELVFQYYCEEYRN